MFFSYFLLEISVQDVRPRTVQKVHSTKRVLLNAAKNLKIKHHDGDEKRIAQLVKKKLDMLYRK